ncbi:MAG: aldose epimerase family protein [Lachnospiraceae bacterium]|nr:aldose epimerase family protein [Lachnospiraceae bacterium]
MTDVKVLEQKENGFAKIQLDSGEVRVILTNIGCQIASVFTKDREGQWGDIVLAPQDLEHPELDSAFMGAVVGRVANRIGGASFELNGKTYQLAKNNGKHCLHGGVEGFNQKKFDYEPVEDGVRFSYVSPDMEEGFPGCVKFTVTVLLKGNEMSLIYGAESDQDTLFAVTNHAYFNLSCENTPIFDHWLQIESDSYMPVDDTSIVTGEVAASAGTPFDFKEGRVIGALDLQGNQQLKNVKGFDHPFVFSKSEDQITLAYEPNGRVVKISTDCPMVHVYTGNFLGGGVTGKLGVSYDDWCGIALETETCPDSIHVEKEPSAILRKGEKFSSVTKYTFEVMK